MGNYIVALLAGAVGYAVACGWVIGLIVIGIEIGKKLS